MGSRLRLSLAVIAGCLSSAAVAAVDPAPMSSSDATRFQAYLRSPDYQSLALQAVGRISPEVMPRCPALVSSPGQITLTKAVTFKDGPTPVTGEWVNRIPVKGCGNDTTLNIRFLFDDQGALRTQVLLPGETQGDLKLQNDALMFALLSAGTIVPDCKLLQVINTAFESYGLKNPSTSDPGAGARYRPWWETWTVAGCGRKFAVPMDFIPDDAGVQIIQQRNDVREN